MSDFEVIKEWQDKNLSNFLKKSNTIIIDKIEFVLDQGMIDHIIDWLRSDDAYRHRKRLSRLAVPDALRLANLWTEKLNKEFKKMQDEALNNEGVESILDMTDGFRFVKLKSEYAYKKEGNMMSHCVGSYFSKDSDIYSLRDKQNNAHCTIEVRENSITQIKGKGNSFVHEKYHDYIISFLNGYDFDAIYTRDVEYINSYVMGNFLLKKDAKVPMFLKINKKIELINQKIEKPVNYIEINGNLVMKNVWNQQIFADEIIVNGDLLLENVKDMLRFCNKIKIMGDLEIVSCHKMKILAKEVEVLGNVYIEDCSQFIQKIKSDGSVEYSDCPLVKS